MIGREISTREGLGLLEYQYGTLVMLTQLLDQGTAGWQLTNTLTSSSHGLLFRAYTEHGMTGEQAETQLERLTGQIEVAIQAGETAQDWLTPVNRASAHVVLVNSDGWVLMQLRSKDAPSSAGLESIPGGKVEPGETPQQCALRELREETGLGPDRLLHGLVPIGSYLDHKPGELVRRYLYHDVTTATDSDVICGEGEAMRFLAPHKIPGLELAELAVQALTPYLPGLSPESPRQLARS